MPTTSATTTRRTRRHLGLLLAAALALVATVGCDQSALSSAVAVNETRASVGRSTLTLDADLSATAERHAEAMARGRSLYHSSSATRPPAGYRYVGENVGRGYSAGGIHGAFKASGGHYHTMTNSAYSAFGVGSALGSDGRLYVSQLYAG